MVVSLDRVTSAPARAPSAPQDAVLTSAADRARFVEQGYLIIRGLIPADKLLQLRRDYERAVDRFKIAQPEQWSSSAQPRLHLEQHGVIDHDNAGAVQLWFDDRLMEVAGRMLALPDPVVTEMMMSCSPGLDHGPSAWHRDIHPHDMAPLQLLQDDLRENGPRYVQWNIPLYDDNVLWVVPGSHLRRNTDAENQQLTLNACAPLPGSIPVDLRAGDAVIYVNYILHWGSNYSAKLRRTIHGGHSLFTQHDHQAPFLPHLDQRSRDLFARWSVRAERLKNLTECALRSAIHRDRQGYSAALDGLHPGVGEAGRLNLSCYLSKLVWQARLVTGQDQSVPPILHSLATATHPITLNWGPAFAKRFTREEVEVLWQRFSWLDSRLRSTQEQFVPGFQSGPMEYRFEDASEPISWRDFISNWG
jgi:ectoine hydroxylase-related dioxygenase (phytanoyl-CoA dioxygenase family)